jgi:hypothetical protein
MIVQFVLLAVLVIASIEVFDPVRFGLGFGHYLLILFLYAFSLFAGVILAVLNKRGTLVFAQMRFWWCSI